MVSLRVGPRWPSLALLGALLCLSGLGCGSKKATVSGKITYKGEALGNGTVIFIGDNNTGGSSQIGSDGSYKIVNIPPGPVKITVETKPLPPSAGSGGPNVESPAMPGMEGKAPPKYVAIPIKYKSAESSGLTYTVVSGEQKHDIPLD